MVFNYNIWFLKYLIDQYKMDINENSLVLFLKIIEDFV